MESKTPRVLFADDHYDTRELFKVGASMRGWQVDVAASAEEMLEHVNRQCADEHECYDVIVSDIRFGVGTLDGLSAVRLIRKKFPDLPVVVLSGLLEPLTISEAKSIGAVPVKKPIDIPDFLERIEQVIYMTQRYTGPERRRRSIPPPNCTQRRRASDTCALEVPPVMRDALRTAARKAG